MPHNVHNFWIALDINGKQHRLATGRRCPDGGFDLTVRMRDSGGMDVLAVQGRADASGRLTLTIRPRLDRQAPQAEIIIET